MISGSADNDTDRLRILITTLASDGMDLEHAVHDIVPELLRIAGRTLLYLRRSQPRFGESEWPWLSGTRPEDLRIQDANKFLCACILEYRAGKADVWDNVAYFTDEVLENPENIWQEILLHSEQGWNELFWEYHLHPEFVVHTRLREAAALMVRFYHGDSRQIWEGFSDNPREVFHRLAILGLPRSTSCLVIGALKDQGFLQGPFDIVGDIVDSRVIARIACGEGSRLTPYQARRLARMICPRDPWNLDRPLYVLGLSYCTPGPRCRLCPAASGCVYAVSAALGVSVGTMIYETLFGQKTIQKSLKNWL